MLVRSGENFIFQLKNLVGSQDSPKMTNKNGKKRMLHNKSNSDMPTKKHKVMEDEQKMYSAETDRRYTISKLVYNFSWTPLLFR